MTSTFRKNARLELYWQPKSKGMQNVTNEWVRKNLPPMSHTTTARAMKGALSTQKHQLTFPARLLTSLLISSNPFLSAFRTNGTISPAGLFTATFTSTLWYCLTKSPIQLALTAGTLRHVRAAALTMKSLTESLPTPTSDKLSCSRACRRSSICKSKADHHM